MGLSSLQIEKLVRDRGLADLTSLALEAGAGAGCGTCRPELEEMLAELAGEAVPESLRRANRARNAAEALRRVETALLGVAARLPPPTEVELRSMDGLRVELHLARNDLPELRALIRERLCKLVCTELEVVFR
jgi:bacterioferritin-associated ferredoxin